MPTSTTLRIFLLGRFEVVCDDRVLPASRWTRRKAASLLQRLALERRLLKDQAIEYLWAEADPGAGANNLYRTLHSLRQTLDAHLGPGTSEHMLGFDDGILSLHEAVWVDAEEFARLGAAAPGEPSRRRAGVLAEALSLYQGELLPDERYAEWTAAPREELRWCQRELRLALGAHARDGGDYPAAITELRTLLAQDPVDEPVHRELMAVYAAAGHRHEALRQYRACVDALAGMLNAPPAPETDALHAQILHQEDAAPIALRQTTPAPAVEATVRAPPLVGRQAELGRVRAALDRGRRGEGRVIWIAGDAGVGKTRLAAEILRVAAADGMTVLVGTAYAQEGLLPFQPFLEALDRYLAGPPRSREKSLLARFRRPGGGEPWALFSTTAALLGDAAARAAVLLAIEDLHAADPASLQLFHYLARHTRTTALVLLATYRSDVAATPDAPLNGLRQSLYRERLSETVYLEPLDAPAVGRLLTHILGGGGASGVAPALFGLDGGDAFFAGGVGRALERGDHLVRAAGAWQLRPGVAVGPHLAGELSEWVRGRVRRLGADVEGALTAAAVLGATVRFDLLREVAGLPDGALLDALDAALAGRLLDETAAGYRFRYPLFRQVLYNQLSHARQTQLRQRAAEARRRASPPSPGAA